MVATASPEEREALLRRVIELLPHMVFAKDGSIETRDDFDRGFRYAYFNAAMDHASGFSRTAMLGQNAKDHFPVHFPRYFDDDRRVMALPPVPSVAATSDLSESVLEIYEPWKVTTGDHVVHTRKVNWGDRFMLGAFILVDGVHLGEQAERRRPVLPPKSPMPPDPSPGFFFAHAFEALPIPLLVSVWQGREAGASSSFVKNAAYRRVFGAGGSQLGGTEAAADALFRGLDASAVPGEIYERSGVEVGGKRWHVLQRPIVREGSDDEIKMVVYAIWNMADSVRTAEARAALKEEA